MIIDAFPFNDELDMLELRLGELNAVVDKFVLVETPVTFRQAPKPLHFQENKQRFSRWLHKIHAISPTLPREGAWYFEMTQRNVLGPVIRDLAKPDDTIVFSDCDEIPNPEVVREYSQNIVGMYNLKQYTFYYNFNNCMNYGRREWSRARIGRVSDFLHWGAYEFRQGPRDLDHSFPSLENGGWHGSYFSVTPERLRRKVHSISHEDMDHIIDGETDRKLIQDVLDGADLFHRSGIGNGECWADDDSRLPKYFLDNRERFRMFTKAHYEDVLRSLP